MLGESAMKKTFIFIAVLVLIQFSSAFAQLPESPRQLTDIFTEAIKVGDATVAGEWGQAQEQAEKIKQMMVEIAPSVQRVIGEHAYKALNGFVVQLQEAIKEKDRSATAGSLGSLEKMNGWLAVKYPSGI